MNKLIITAFEPFGIIPTNSSLEVLKALSNEFQKIVLPVSYEKCEDIIKKILLEQKPDYLLLLGQAQNRRTIALEQIAINYINTPTRDNDGKFYLNQLIKADGNHGYFNTIHADRIVEELAPNHPIHLSYSAGVYVCNYTFYLALYYIDKYKLPTKVGFIHYPLYRNQIEEEPSSIELSTMVDVTTHIIQLLLENKKSN